MTMLVHRLLVLVFAAILATACSTTPTSDIKINAESAANTDFSNFKNYAWVGSAQLLNDQEWRWEPPEFDLDAEVRWLVDSQLRQKGLSEVNSNPDLLVAYVAGVNMDALEEVKDVKTHLTTLENVPKGALMVILVDTASASVIWGATASADIVQERTTEAMRARLEYAVKQMFSGFPR